MSRFEESIAPYWEPALFMGKPKGEQDQLKALAILAIKKDKGLQDCLKTDKSSVYEGIVKAARMGLAINDGMEHAYLIKYGKRAELVLGYRGMMKLARQSGIRVEAQCVYDGDDFGVTLGLEPNIEHIPMYETTKLTHVYAIAHLPDGQQQFEVMTKAQVDKRRDSSPGRNSGPWTKWYEEMARKTVIRKLCGMLPQNDELALAVAHEDNVEMVGDFVADVEPEPTVELDEDEGYDDISRHHGSSGSLRDAEDPPEDRR